MDEKPTTDTIEPKPDVVSSPDAATPKAKRGAILPIIRGLLHNKIVCVALIAAVILGAGGGYWLTQRPVKSTNSSTPGGVYNTGDNNDSADTSTPEPAANLAAVDPVSINGATYLGQPKKLDNLHFFKDFKVYFNPLCADQKECESLLNDGALTYYEVGTTKDKQRIIVVYNKGYNIDGDFMYIALETKSNTYQILGQHDYALQRNLSTPDQYSEQSLKDFSTTLSANVTLNKTTQLSELVFPKEANVANQKIATSYTQMPYFMPDGLSSMGVGSYNQVDNTKTYEVTKRGTTGAYTLYETNYSDKANYSVRELRLTLAGSFAVVYVPNGEISKAKDANVPITWTKGDKEGLAAFSGSGGCGSTGYITAKNLSASDMVQYGTSTSGQKVYQLATTHALFKELYTDDYKPGADSEWTDAKYKNLTEQQFSDMHGFFLVQNSFDEYVVFQRSGMFQRGGCGKPVIYLYPTTTTNVDVRVGADVIKSEPFYEPTGWQNVLAEPNGQLSYHGQGYDSLFWEGYGHGPYPEVTSGTVVATAQAPALMQTQLAQQGLNNKEIADFMAFWQPKLPATPFVRLTWFGTAAMNRLAPLDIYPTPRTTIRTFLDFEGLQTAIDLPAQQFSAPKRNGFTVVEWGGLLREGIY